MKYGIVINVIKDSNEIQVKPIGETEEVIVLNATSLQCSDLEEVMSDPDNSEEPIVISYDEAENALIEE